MKHPRPLLLLSVLFIFCSCHKRLTESSGRSLLQEHIDHAQNPRLNNGDLLFDYSSMSRNWIGHPTLVDSGTPGTQGSNAPAQLAEFERAGFVEHTKKVVSYPNLTGSFAGSYDWHTPWPPGQPISTLEFSLQSSPDGSSYLGGWKTDPHCSGQLRANVIPDGTKVKLLFESGDWSNCFGLMSPGEASVDVHAAPDGTVRLTGEASARHYQTHRPTVIDVVGKAGGQPHSLTWHTYTLSKQFVSLVPGETQQVRGGHVSVQAISDLRLQTDTIATARFSWSASLNRAAQLLTGKPTINGAGEVAFQKKPDGTWVVGEFQLGR